MQLYLRRIVINEEPVFSRNDKISSTFKKEEKENDDDDYNHQDDDDPKVKKWGSLYITISRLFSIDSHNPQVSLSFLFLYLAWLSHLISGLFGS